MPASEHNLCPTRQAERRACTKEMGFRVSITVTRLVFVERHVYRRKLCETSYRFTEKECVYVFSWAYKLHCVFCFLCRPFPKDPSSSTWLQDLPDYTYLGMHFIFKHEICIFLWSFFLVNLQRQAEMQLARLNFLYICRIYFINFCFLVLFLVSIFFYYY